MFFAGADDPAIAHITEVHGALRSSGLPVQLEVVPHLAHEYPPDLTQLLIEALRFSLDEYRMKIALPIGLSGCTHATGHPPG